MDSIWLIKRTGEEEDFYLCKTFDGPCNQSSDWEFDWLPLSCLSSDNGDTLVFLGSELEALAYIGPTWGTCKPVQFIAKQS